MIEGDDNAVFPLPPALSQMPSEYYLDGLKVTVHDFNARMLVLILKELQTMNRRQQQAEFRAEGLRLIELQKAKPVRVRVPYSGNYD